MKLNTLSVIVGVMVLLICVIDLIQRLPTVEQQNKQDNTADIAAINLPVLPQSLAQQTVEYFKVEDEDSVDEAGAEADTEQKVIPRADELTVAGKLMRLVAVFESEAKHVAIIEQRDETSGEKSTQIQVKKQDAIGTFSVSDISLNKLIISNDEKTIIFEMYKKPRLIKG